MFTSQADSPNFPSDKRASEEEFVRLFVQYQRVLFVYLRTALGNPADAEEVMQETSIILWHDRQQFVVGTSFVNWAMTIAQNQVHKFRRSRKHIPHPLAADLLDQIAAQTVARHDLSEARHQALEQCLQTLSERERHLISAAYSVQATKKMVSQDIGVTPSVFYKALNRIRQRLLKCINYRLLAEGRE